MSPSGRSDAPPRMALLWRSSATPSHAVPAVLHAGTLGQSQNRSQFSRTYRTAYLCFEHLPAPVGHLLQSSCRHTRACASRCTTLHAIGHLRQPRRPSCTVKGRLVGSLVSPAREGAIAASTGSMAEAGSGTAQPQRLRTRRRSTVRSRQPAAPGVSGLIEAFNQGSAPAHLSQVAFRRRQRQQEEAYRQARECGGGAPQAASALQGHPALAPRANTQNERHCRACMMALGGWHTPVRSSFNRCEAKRSASCVCRCDGGQHSSTPHILRASRARQSSSPPMDRSSRVTSFLWTPS